MIKKIWEWLSGGGKKQGDNRPLQKKPAAAQGFQSEQVSSGGVVYKKTGTNIDICMVMRLVNRREIWCLPKGHLEAGEGFAEAALREVREETGVHASIVSPLRAITYSFYDRENKKRVSKTVHFFLMNYSSGDLADHDDEVTSAKWWPVGEVLSRAAYPGEREVLELAIKQLV